MHKIPIVYQNQTFASKTELRKWLNLSRGAFNYRQKSPWYDNQDLLTRLNLKSIRGRKYNHLTAIKPVDPNIKIDKISNKPNQIWYFRCDCGVTIQAPINSVANHKKKSCGHINSQVRRTARLKYKQAHPDKYQAQIDNNIKKSQKLNHVNLKQNNKTGFVGIRTCVRRTQNQIINGYIASYMHNRKNYQKRTNDLRDAIIYRGSCELAFQDHLQPALLPYQTLIKAHQLNIEP